MPTPDADDAALTAALPQSGASTFEDLVRASVQDPLASSGAWFGT